jgi:hypothetical protein
VRAATALATAVSAAGDGPGEAAEAATTADALAIASLDARAAGSDKADRGGKAGEVFEAGAAAPPPPPLAGAAGGADDCGVTGESLGEIAEESGPGRGAFGGVF